jgi:hypothetical protein
MTLLDTTTVNVTLTRADEFIARQGGIWRQDQNVAAGLRNAYGLEAEGYDAHIKGARAEAAVAKHLDRWWSPGERGAADVGAYQVRYTSHTTGGLIIHPDDDDAAPFILVTGGPFRFVLVGWIWGGHAKRDNYWADPAGGRAAFFVPQVALYAMSELPAL